MRVTLSHLVFAMLAFVFAEPAFADGRGDAGPDRAAPPVRAAPIQQPANTAPAEGRTGQFSLNNGELTMNVPAGYKFYSAEEALAFLQRNNAATPSGTVLGMVARADADVRAPGTWATVVSYDAIGYVQPETASGLAEANFEDSVRSARQTQQRPFEGFIAPPAYTSDASYLMWAERSAAPGAGGKDLRHEQKMLGRYGVACLTSIGSADQMDDITAAAPDVRAMLSFPEGRRHSDFQAASDQVSTYSVPGLVTGVPNAQPQAVAESVPETQTAFGGLSGMFPWIAGGVVVLAALGYVLMGRRRRGAEAADEA